MKTVIIGIASLMLSVFVFLCVQDIKTYQQYNFELRFACEELSATGALYNDKVEYGDGRMVFNRIEATKAIESQLKSLLRTDDSLNPLVNSYWTGTIKYKVYFYDDSNMSGTSFFVDPDTGYTCTIAVPTVIVTIDAGKGRFHYPEIVPSGNCIRSASHEWVDRH